MDTPARPRWWRLVALLLALSLVAAACGDDDGGDDAASPPGGDTDAEPTAPTPGVTATSIKVAGLGTMTSPRQATYVGMDVGAKVVFDKVNAAGGIAGRTIDFLGVFDDNDNNETNAEQARKLVQQEKVFAVAPVITNFFAGAEFLQRANTPYFGWAFHEAFCNTEQGFGFSGCLVAKGADVKSTGWPAMMLELFPDLEKVAFIAEDTDAGRNAVPQFVRGAPHLGLEVVYADTSLPFGGGPDLTPYVQEIISAEPDIVFMTLAAAAAIQLAGRLKAAGYEGIIAAPTTYDPRIAAAPQVAEALDGVYNNVGFDNFQSTSKGIRTMLADVEEYAPADTLITQPLASGYFSALLLVRILEEVGEDLTHERFYEVANGGFTYDADGAIGEITYPEAHEISPQCGSIAQLKDGKYVSSLKLTCYPRPS